jgi:hypothetical protein
MLLLLQQSNGRNHHGEKSDAELFFVLIFTKLTIFKTYLTRVSFPPDTFQSRRTVQICTVK